MPEVDTKLKQQLQKANSRERANPMYFAFAANGSASCGLVLSNKNITGGEITEAKAKAGGGKAVTGQCFNDGKCLKFETENAPPATAKKRKAAVAALRATIR